MSYTPFGSLLDVDLRGYGSIQSHVSGEIESEIRRVDLQQAPAPFELADDSFGVIGGRLKVWVRGDTVGLFLLMTGGRLDALLTEAAGLDIGEALVARVGNDDGMPIDSSYVNMHTRSGIAQLDTALVDIRDTLFLADGFIDFNQELVDLVIDPRPKDFSLFSLRSGLHIEGRLKQPAGYPGDALFARAGAAAALARSVDGVGNVANRLEVKQF